MFFREVQVSPAEQTNDSRALGCGFDPPRDIKFSVQFSFLFDFFLCFNYFEFEFGFGLWFRLWFILGLF